MSAVIRPEDGIKLFAAKISSQPLLGLVVHKPEIWAQPRRCFENVWEKVKRDGGSDRFGWTFQHCVRENIGSYLCATHHAVWNAANGALINVTPYPDQKLHPLSIDGSIVFLVDDAALPVSNTHVDVAPLPLKYFAMDDNAALISYVEQLTHDEQVKCQAIYEGRIALTDS